MIVCFPNQFKTKEPLQARRRYTNYAILLIYNTVTISQLNILHYLVLALW